MPPKKFDLSKSKQKLRALSSMRLLAATAFAGLLSPCASADVFNMPAGQTSMSFVPVGDVGNVANDNGLGSVNYAYNMGTYDVTAAQYTVFLNHVASTADTYGLYNPGMVAGGSGFNVGCGITQTPVGGGFTYSVTPGQENFPVNFVAWRDAARVANWLAN